MHANNIDYKYIVILFAKPEKNREQYKDYFHVFCLFYFHTRQELFKSS